MPELVLKLPFPPTVNTYWRHVMVQGRPRTLLSKRGRTYRCEVTDALSINVMGQPLMTGRLAVTIQLCPPDKRRRDLDNLPKGILDALTHAGIWADDEQIDSLHLIRGDTGKPGHAMVSIQEL